VVRKTSLGLDKKLKYDGKLCYLDDSIGTGGGAEEASRARMRSAWAKFRELATWSKHENCS